jgi:hypothetical protein
VSPKRLAGDHERFGRSIASAGNHLQENVAHNTEDRHRHLRSGEKLTSHDISRVAVTENYFTFKFYSLSREFPWFMSA